MSRVSCFPQDRLSKLQALWGFLRCNLGWIVILLKASDFLLKVLNRSVITHNLLCMSSLATNGHLTLFQLSNLDMTLFVKSGWSVTLSFTFNVLILERVVADYKFYKKFLTWWTSGWTSKIKANFYKQVKMVFWRQWCLSSACLH